MNEAAPVAYSADADRVGWIVFHDPAGRANVFNPATQAALGAALDAAEADRPVALVVMSGLERIFIVGADLAWLGAIPDAGAAMELARRGQRLFQRLADFPGPVVCAIHGACAGGGFELALACDWRVASDAPATRIGLPETGIGTIPGWGGCVRLPRLIGVQAALDHILKAQLLGASEALRVGLVDEVVSAAELKSRARALALHHTDFARLRRTPRPVAGSASDFDFKALRVIWETKTRGQLPAPLAAIAAVEEGAQRSVAEALEIEACRFGEVTAGATCKNLIHAFQLREAARKRTLKEWFGVAQASAPASGADAGGTPALQPIRKVGVVGAGVMGSGIAHWLALHNLDVVLREIDAESLVRGVAVIRRLLDEAVKRGRLEVAAADAALQRIATTTAWDGFAACDVVIEAIVEDIATKRRLFAEIAGNVGPNAVLASNTSALPVEEIAADVATAERAIGIHFFNPVARMPLVELVLGEKTSMATAARALTLVKALGKSPIICRSSPGFLVTRVLFFYLNAAVHAWEQGAPAAAIDAALRDFGWPMGPLRLIDEVGVDVTDSIFREMEHYFPKRFSRSKATERLLAAGLKGRKNGASRGFYCYGAGGVEQVNDAETRPLALAGGSEAASGSEPARSHAREQGEIRDHLMRVMVAEAERCVAEGVVKSADDVDFALLSGAGFPAFRGGLLHWARGSGGPP